MATPDDSAPAAPPGAPTSDTVPALPPLDGPAALPTLDLDGETPDHDDDMTDLPIVSATVGDYINDLVTRIRTGDFETSVGAVRQALAQVGVATTDAGTIVTPAGPAPIPATVTSQETIALALIARKEHGRPVTEFVEMMALVAGLPDGSPAGSDPVAMAQLSLMMKVGTWAAVGLQCPDELEVNFVPQFLAAMCRARQEPTAWLLNGNGSDEATIDALGMQLLFYGYAQAMSPVGPAGTLDPSKLATTS